MKKYHIERAQLYKIFNFLKAQNIVDNNTQLLIGGNESFYDWSAELIVISKDDCLKHEHIETLFHEIGHHVDYIGQPLQFQKNANRKEFIMNIAYKIIKNYNLLLYIYTHTKIEKRANKIGDSLRQEFNEDIQKMLLW